METASQLVVMVAFGLACALLARRRGRNRLGWFFIGCLLNVAGLILLLVLPNLGLQEARERMQDTEVRRLRERAAKDRQVAEGRHAETLRRLGVHDRALALDTSSSNALGADHGSPLSADPRGELEPIELERAEWYIARGWPPAPVGPLPFEELLRLAREREIEGSTLVWSEAIVEWRPARTVPGLEELHRV